MPLLWSFRAPVLATGNANATLAIVVMRLVSVLAYAGFRPAEARALRWGDIRERTILVERAADAWSVKKTKTGKIRSVRLLAPLAHDLAWWRSRCPNPRVDALVFPTPRGGLWTKDDRDNWRNRVFKPTAGRISASRRPYDLRHTFASLLIASGGTVVEIAAQLGHDPALTLGAYAHAFDEFDFGSRPDPVEMIQAARLRTGVREMYAEPAEAGLTNPREPGAELEADARTRTADPFIPRTPRRLWLVAVRGTECLGQANFGRFALWRFAAAAGWCVAHLLPLCGLC
jgi:Phage integrase family